MSEARFGPKPIETRYNGFLFRSRLEARYAVLLDALHVAYDYEVEGFDLGDGVFYLPDFYLTDQDVWLEVKPGFPHDGDAACVKAQRLAIATERSVYVVPGIPKVPADAQALWFTPYGDPPEFVKWFICPVCQNAQFGTAVWDLPCGCLPFMPQAHEIADALNLARQARFEFGDRARGPREDRP